MSNTTIKISQLPNIGGNLSVNSLFPVVDTQGTLTTEKVSFGNIANFILNEAGNLLPEAFVSTIAFSVANSSQPNITSVGNLVGLTVNNLENFYLPGGENGFFLQTDGNGNLVWAGAGAGNGSPGGSNNQIQYNVNGFFNGDPTLTFDQSTATLNTVNIATSDITIYGNTNTIDLNATGNVNSNNIIAVSNIEANYFIGNGSQLTGLTFNANASGPDTSLQYNNNGVFAGNANLTYDAANSQLEVQSIYIANGGNIYENGGNTLIVRTEPTHIFEVWGNDGASDYKWSFEQDGHLRLPGNTAFLRGDVDLLQLYCNNANQSGISLFEDFELSATQNVQIFSNNANTPYIWTFGPDGNLTIPGNVIPDANITYDLGTSANRFKDIWLANSTIHLGDANITANGNSIVVDSITVTGGNIGNIGNIASINLDGNVNTYLRGDGTWDASASGYSGYSGVSGYSGQVGLSGLSGFSGVNGLSGYSGFIGESGYSGISGFSGESGYSGISGFSGESGYSGISGYTGYSGDSGYSGTSGFTGYSGESGYSGISGFSGESGYSGDSGYSGISGYSGYSGISGFSGSGISGYSGISGFSGESGYSGISGFSGESGYSGVSGYSGLSGFSGAGGGLPLANGSSNFDIASTDSNVTITANGTYTWTFGTDGNLTLPGNISGNTNGFTIGYLDIPQVSASNTTLQLSDAGKHYYSTTVGNLTLTIPNNATTSFATGTAVSVVVQAAGNVLVNAASGVTLYMAGSSTSGNRVVGSYGMATLLKVSTDTWFINGTGVY